MGEEERPKKRTITRMFTPEQEAFFRANCREKSYAECASIMNEKFGLDLTTAQIKAWRTNHHFYGVKGGGTFQKGQEPWNKGMKGWCAEGCTATQFKKGHVPHNTREIGAVTNCNGSFYVKTWDNIGNGLKRNGWENWAHMVYRENFGEIPEGHIIIHLDGDASNNDPDNLMAVTRGENAVANSPRIFGAAAGKGASTEMKKAAILAARVMIKAHEMSRKRHNRKKRQRKDTRSWTDTKKKEERESEGAPE